MLSDQIHAVCVKRRAPVHDAASNFDARPGMGWTVLLRLSIGRHVKFDTLASKFRRARKTY